MGNALCMCACAFAGLACTGLRGTYMNDAERVITVSTPDWKMGGDEGQEADSHTRAHRAVQLMDSDAPSSARGGAVESSPRDVGATPKRRLAPLPPKIKVAQGAEEV